MACMRPLVLALASVLIATTEIATAAVDRWSTTGPAIGMTTVSSVIADVRSPGLVYAVTPNGIGRSVDGGRSWLGTNAGIADQVISLALDPEDPATLWAGTAGGALFRSIDGGGSWQATSFSATEEELAGNGVVAVTASRGAVYVTTAAGFYRSGDRGKTWRKTYASSFMPGWMTTLAIDPATPERVYAGLNEGLLVSSDAGESWSNVVLPLSRQHVSQIAFSAGVLYVVSNHAIFESADRGATWRILYATPLAGRRRAVGAHPDVEISSIAIASADLIYIGTNFGVWKAAQNAGQWSVTTSMSGAAIRAIAFERGDILASAEMLGVFRTSDHGASWQPSNSGFPAASAFRTAIDAFGARAVAATEAGVFRMEDGARWAELKSGMTGVKSVTVNWKAGPTIVAANADHTSRSTDNGLTWTRVQPDPKRIGGATALSVDHKNPGTMYATIADEIAKSRDDGATWDVTGVLSYFVGGYGPYGMAVGHDIQVDPQSPTTIYVAGSFAIYKTPDAGNSWTSLTRSFDVVANAIAVDPRDSNVIYAAVMSASKSSRLEGVIVSRDGGAHWELLAQMASISSIVIDPVQRTTLYAGTTTGSVYVSRNSGGTWTPLSDGLRPNGFVAGVQSLVIDDSGSTLFASTTAGVFTYTHSSP